MYVALLVGLASAHLPHDNVRAVAAPLVGDPAGDPTGDGGGTPWWLLADPSGTALLLRSDDDGHTFGMVGGEPVADHPLALGRLDDGALVVLGHTRYWWSRDEGATWASAPLPGEVDQLRGGAQLVLAGPDGLWTGAPGALDLVVTGEIVALADGPAGVVVVDAQGAVWDGTAWTDGPGVSDASTIVAVEAALYVGTRSGSVWRHADGAWTACGPLPAPDGDAPVDIVALAHDGPVVLAATGWRAPFASANQCTSWIDRGTPHDVDYDAVGGAETVDDAYPVLDVVDGRWLVAGWMGLWWSADQGATWTEAPVVPPDYTRGLLFAGDFATSGRVWVGTYAAGPAATADGGETYTCPAVGLGDSNVQLLTQAHDPADAETIFGIIGWDAQASRDGGATWARLTPGPSDVSVLATFDDADEVWVFGAAEDGAQQIVRSGDAGATWTPVTSLAGALDGDHAGPLGGWTTPTGARARCLSRHGAYGIVCTVDDGQTWTSGARGGTSNEGTAPVGWPPGAATRVVWTDDHGVHLSDDLGRTTRDVAPSGADTPIALVGADDGSLYFATRAGVVWRSLDGGDAWVDLGLRAPAWIHVMTAAPGFAAQPLLLLGTHDGIFFLAGANGPSPTLERWARWERVDGTSGYVECASCPVPPDDPTTVMDALLEVPANAVAAAWLRGTRVRILGQLRGGAQVRVDGVVVGLLDESVPGVPGDFGGFTDGWHHVQIEGTNGDGVAIDAIEGYGDGAVLPLPAGVTPTVASAECVRDVVEPATQGCGCVVGSARRGWGFLGVVGLVAARRRARVSPLTTRA